MCRKIVFVGCVVVVLSMAMKASAVGYYYFSNGGGDQKWNNMANWGTSELTLPSYENVSDVYLGYTPASTASVPVIIDGTMATASFWGLNVGIDTSAEVDIVSGGRSGIPGSAMFVGCNEWVGTSAGHGVVNIDGAGSVGYGESWTIASGNVTAANCGSGIVNITNGGQMVLGWWGSSIGTKGTGTVNIINGIMWYWGGGLTLGSGGLIDIRGSSQLQLNGDLRTQVQGWANSGNLKGNGVAGVNAVSASFNPTSGWTTVTATPEPATLAILGLGGLLLRRRSA